MALEEMYNSRISRNQQDSQEFLHLIHEALSLEDTRLKKQDPNPEKFVVPPNPFEGELSTQIKCQRCNFTTPWKKEPFTELSVAVPSKAPPLRKEVTLIAVELYVIRVFRITYHNRFDPRLRMSLLYRPKYALRTRTNTNKTRPPPPRNNPSPLHIKSSKTVYRTNRSRHRQNQSPLPNRMETPQSPRHKNYNHLPSSTSSSHTSRPQRVRTRLRSRPQ